LNRSVSYLTAIGFSLVGYVLWTCSDAFMKLASAMPKYEILGFGGLGGAITILCISLWSGGAGKLRSRRPMWTGALGFLYVINYILAAWAFFRLPLSNFYVVTFLAPPAIAVLSPILLRERIGWQQGLATIAGFVGVVIAVNPGSLLGDTFHWMGYVAAFACMFLTVAQMMMLRVLGPHESRESMIFFQRILALLAAAAMCAVAGFEPITTKEFVYATLTGVLGSIGWLCMAYAHKIAPATLIAPFHYIRLIVGAVLGYLIWQDLPTLHLVIGAVIIIASGLYLAAHARKAEKLAEALLETQS